MNRHRFVSRLLSPARYIMSLTHCDIIARNMNLRLSLFWTCLVNEPNVCGIRLRGLFRWSHQSM